MDVVKGLNDVVSVINQFNPVDKLVDTGCDLLGMNAQAKAVAKMSVGAATGNVLMVVGGATALGTTLAEPPAQTQYAASSKPEVCNAGYARPARVDPKLLETERHLMTMQRNLDKLDSAGAFLGIHDGRFARDNLVNVANSKDFSPDLRAAARFFLENSALFDGLDTAANYGGRDGLAGLADVESMLGHVRNEIRAQSSRPPATVHHIREEKSLKVTTTKRPPMERMRPQDVASSQPTNESHLDPNIGKYQQVLNTLLQNWEVFDTAVGRPDEYITRENLRAIQDNPHASVALKAVADFLLEHPEYFNRLETAARVGNPDGIIGKGDVFGDLQRVNGEIAQYGLPTVSTEASANASLGSDPFSTDSSGSKVTDIVRDPTLTLEEKINLVMVSILEGLDAGIERAMEDVANAQDRVAQRKDAQASQGAKGDKDHNAQLAKAEREAKMVEQRLQTLIEKRKQMMDLLSNMNSKFNEMARTAIQNLGRA